MFLPRFHHISLAIFTLLASTAHAETNLAPVVVNGELPAESAVPAQRIAVQQALGLQDIFKQTLDVNVGGGALVSLQKLYLRGISERMLRITIDGAAQPEAAYHHSAQVMIEPELMRQVDVQAGSGNASSGPGALAGVLRFTTLSASDLLRPGETAGGMLKANYFTNQRGHKLSSTVFARLGAQTGLLLHSSQLQGHDYRDGNGARVANSAVDASNHFAKLDLQTNTNNRFTWVYERQQDQGWRNKRSNLLPASFNPADSQRSERESSSMHYEQKSAAHQLALTAFANQNLIYLAQGTKRAERDGSRSMGMDINLRSRVGQHQLSYGANWRQDTGFAQIAGQALPSETSGQAGLFVQDDFALGEQWQLELGARYDRYRYVDGKQQRYHAAGFSPSAALSFAPADAWLFRLSYAQALRGVGLLEPFLLAFQDNAATLAPEKARKWELNSQWQGQQSWRGWQASASVYQQNINNYLGYDDTRKNLGQVKVNGYSLRVAYQAPSSNLSASLGVAQAKPSLNGQALGNNDALLLGNATGRNWLAQVDYAIPRQQMTLGATWRAVERLRYLPPDSPEKAGYAVLDAYCQWQALPQEKLTLTLTIKNLLNKNYHDQASFGYHPRWGKVAALPEAGRDVRLVLNWRL